MKKKTNEKIFVSSFSFLFKKSLKKKKDAVLTYSDISPIKLHLHIKGNLSKNDSKARQTQPIF